MRGLVMIFLPATVTSGYNSDNVLYSTDCCVKSKTPLTAVQPSARAVCASRHGLNVACMTLASLQSLCFGEVVVRVGGDPRDTLYGDLAPLDQYYVKRPEFACIAKDPSVSLCISA